MHHYHKLSDANTRWILTHEVTSEDESEIDLDDAIETCNSEQSVCNEDTEISNTIE